MRSDADAVLLATRSTGKLRQLRLILGAEFGPIITLDDIGLAPEPEEDDIEGFDTFLANAHAKAAWFTRRTGMSVMADDSGICVAALDGAPGVRSRRFAADSDPEFAGLDGTALDAANNGALLRALDTVPRDHRQAHYFCAAVLHRADGARIAALGTCRGTILTAARGEGGFGYDPLFSASATGISFAEMQQDDRNLISHRSRAFRALAQASSSR